MFVSVTIFHHSNYTDNYRIKMKKKCTNLLLTKYLSYLGSQYKGRRRKEEKGGGSSRRGVIRGAETEGNEKPRN